MAAEVTAEEADAFPDLGEVREGFRTAGWGKR
jgi:hypothetical protein